MDETLIAAIVIAIIPIYPGWLMCQKAYFMSRWRPLMVLLCLVLTAGLTGGFFYLPFWLAKGQEREYWAMLTDFILWGVCPLALLALAAYVMDHFEERPFRAALAGTACFALALLPLAFYFLAPQLQADLGITVSSPPGID